MRLGLSIFFLWLLGGGSAVLILRNDGVVVILINHYDVAVIKLSVILTILDTCLLG